VGPAGERQVLRRAGPEGKPLEAWPRHEPTEGRRTGDASLDYRARRDSAGAPSGGNRG
jgi:hypothetical protein